MLKGLKGLHKTFWGTSVHITGLEMLVFSENFAYALNVWPLLSHREEPTFSHNTEIIYLWYIYNKFIFAENQNPFYCAYYIDLQKTQYLKNTLTTLKRFRCYFLRDFNVKL